MSSPHPDTRQSLILRLRNASDLAAWREFHEIYSPVVVRVARRRGLQDADAAEILQDVMWAVAQAVGRFEPQGQARFRTWLARIVRHKLADAVRRRTRQPSGVGGTTLSEALLQQMAPGAGLSELIEHEYRMERLRRAADVVRKQASASTWDAFWLTSVRNLSASDAAQQLRLSVGAVYIARSRVIARLRALVEEQE